MNPTPRNFFADFAIAVEFSSFLGILTPEGTLPRQFIHRRLETELKSPRSVYVELFTRFSILSTFSLAKQRHCRLRAGDRLAEKPK